MKISYNWLKDYVDHPFDVTELAERLTMLGFEVESVEKISLDYPEVVTGKVLSREKHPDADRLSVCRVDVAGAEPLTIVCGAPNVAAGQVVAVARVGAGLPGGLTIRKAKIRGVESRGMICSREELGFPDKSDGIWELPAGIAAGLPLAQALDFETDYQIEASVLPDRPDAMSHIGLAREIAAACATPLRLPQLKLSETTQSAAAATSVQIDCPASCPRYAARIIRQVKPGQSPQWLVRRLEAAGMRSLGVMVDVTNYVMLETGQPLHAFDYDTLAGGRIIVREAQAGESFVTLDNKRHQLPGGTVLICDAEKPVAIGGIMGGLNSEVSENTRTILLESAHFEALGIRKNARRLGIVSEASQRFARGSDPNGVPVALDRAAQLLAELAGGEVDAGQVDVYPEPLAARRLPLQAGRINQLLGTTLPGHEMMRLLESIGFQSTGNEEVLVPTFRPDVLGTADLAEEVGRLFGFDNIPAAQLSSIPYRNVLNPLDDFLDRLRNEMTGAGYQEVITNSMINSQNWQRYTGEDIYPILNPISADMDGMRNSLMPSLLEVVRFNLNRQRRSLALFEINTTFHHPGNLEQQPQEVLRLGIALAGMRREGEWHGSDETYDFFDIKGIVEQLSDKFLLDNVANNAYDNFAVELQSQRIFSGGDEVGFMGKLSPRLAKQFDLEIPVFLAELRIMPVFESAGKSVVYREIARYPFVERDLALVVDRDKPAGAMQELIRESGGNYLQQVKLFDMYAGKQIEQGKKSVAFRMIFQAPDKTLTEEEVTRATARILKQLESKFGATLRS